MEDFASDTTKAEAERTEQGINIHETKKWPSNNDCQELLLNQLMLHEKETFYVGND
jgi:hypothetical protein